MLTYVGVAYPNSIPPMGHHSLYTSRRSHGQRPGIPTKLNSISTPGPILSSYADPPTSRILHIHPPSTQNSSCELSNLSHPLRPIWITPATTTFPSIPDTRTFLPVIYLSASKQVQAGTERRSVGFSYVQGSGDDHELWSIASV